MAIVKIKTMYGSYWVPKEIAGKIRKHQYELNYGMISIADVFRIKGLSRLWKKIIPIPDR